MTKIKNTFSVGRMTQYMPIRLVFTLWSLNKSKSCYSKPRSIDRMEDAYS